MEIKSVLVDFGCLQVTAQVKDAGAQRSIQYTWVTGKGAHPWDIPASWVDSVGMAAEEAQGVDPLRNIPGGVF